MNHMDREWGGGRAIFINIFRFLYLYSKIGGGVLQMSSWIMAGLLQSDFLKILFGERVKGLE